MNFNDDLKLSGFKAYEVNQNSSGHTYSRKDFYKISITSGEYVFNYADKRFETTKTILFFGNPLIPYSCEVIKPPTSGFACLFSEKFISQFGGFSGIIDSPLFKIGGTPIVTPDESELESIYTIFKLMIKEQSSSYQHKDDVIRNYISLLTHEAMKLQPVVKDVNEKNAAKRITLVFMELLERQFPVEFPDQPLVIKTPNDFANQMAVHVNHLNRSIKEVTGKTTNALISERVIAESKLLLQNTNLDITHIAYSLGFDYPTYFNNYFKRYTGTNPSTYRSKIV
jgi:AraC-like DNA-binding protein